MPAHSLGARFRPSSPASAPPVAPWTVLRIRLGPMLRAPDGRDCLGTLPLCCRAGEGKVVMASQGRCAVIYERDESGAWNGRVPEVPGAHTEMRSAPAG